MKTKTNTKTKKWTDLKNKHFTPVQREKIRAEAMHDLLVMNLVELRQEAGVTQASLAQDIEVAQSEISRLEKRDDRLVSSLRKYVEGLGGKLEVVAVLGNKRITLAV